METTQYNLKIKKDLLERVKAQAEKDQRSTNKEINYIIEKFLNDEYNK